MSILIWSLCFSDVVWICKRMSIAIEIKSDTKFSVKNQWKRVSIAKLSTNGLLEIIHFKILCIFRSESGLWHVIVMRNINPDPNIIVKAKIKY